jgi:hypothetical protein
MAAWMRTNSVNSILAELLDEFIESSPIYSGIISNNGEIIATSTKEDLEMDWESFVKIITIYLESFQYLDIIPYEIALLMRESKIIITQFIDERRSSPYLLILRIDPQNLYYKRMYNKFVKKLSVILL